MGSLWIKTSGKIPRQEKRKKYFSQSKINELAGTQTWLQRRFDELLKRLSKSYLLRDSVRVEWENYQA